MKLQILGGRIIDPSLNMDRPGDLYISDGLLTKVVPDEKDGETIDASGMWVVPGLIDSHVHLREPGQEQKEDLSSGLRAAAAGGFTGVLPMPNTVPVIDTTDLTHMLIERAAELKGTRIYPVPAVTKGREGRELTDMAALVRAGAVAFSDDGTAVVDDNLMRRALETCRTLGVPLCQHSEDPALSANGVMHQGVVSSRLELPGWPSEAEERIVNRDIALAEETGAHLHVSHISTKGAVSAVRRAKGRGIGVTAEVTPHHLHLTDEEAERWGTQAKVNPPLRPLEDRDACREGLADGTIDIIATDHAPHTAKDKEKEWQDAAFGMVGLELAVPLMLALIEKNCLTPLRLIEALSTGPARLFSLPGGTLAPGSPADVTIIDPNAPWEVDPSKFKSKGRNTPFSRWPAPGRTRYTIVGGQVVFRHV